jgi:protein-tyrosine-phosphatase
MTHKRPIKIAFVCLENRNRSPTAETMFKELATRRGYKYFTGREMDYDLEIISAGLYIVQGNNRRDMTDEIASSFDHIVAMDKDVKNCLINGYKLDPERVTNLEVPNIYSRNQPELVDLLRPRLEDLADSIGLTARHE